MTTTTVAPTRMRFLSQATKTGARWLVDVSNHAGRVLALAGVLIGFSITGFFTEPLIGMLT